MRHLTHHFQFVVIGGGFAGMCAAITAARSGIITALVQDRPVLGGNAGKEIRVTPVGADNCNFLYSRETGLIEEIMLKNLHDNPDFSYEGFDIVLKDFVKAESNLTCFLHTSVMEIEISTSGELLKSVKGYTSGSETWHTFHAPFFADCTGDATVGALAGAPFRIGIEARSEFNEPMCEEAPQDYCMGGSVQFHTTDTGSPKPFKKPEWIKLDLEEEDFGPTRPVNKDFFRNNGGYWWIEVGGGFDTVHETEKIREGASEIVYATWDYLKNKSPLKEKLINYELDWVAPIAGKRESRRLEGDYILSMGDIESQRHFPDSIAFGGWGFDHHPPGGFFDKENGSYHVYHAGPYNIPLRCLYSKQVTNLFMAGRNISASHYALSSTRVMFTTAQLGEAIGTTAFHCVKEKMIPRRLFEENLLFKIQNDLIRNDHHIHNWPVTLPDDIAPHAKITASSVLLSPDVIESCGIQTLQEDKMLLFPVVTDSLQGVDLYLDASVETMLEAEFFQGPATNSTFPEKLICSVRVNILQGSSQWVRIPLFCKISRPGWHFLVLKSNSTLSLHTGKANVGTGNYSLRPYDPIRPDPSSKWHTGKAALYGKGEFQHDAFCFQLHPPQSVYMPENVINSFARPTNIPNLWSSGTTDFSDPEWIDLEWDTAMVPREIDLLFDSMLDFHFVQKWGGYPGNVLPSIVKHYRLWALDRQGNKKLIDEVRDNFQRLRKHSCSMEEVKSIRLEILGTNGINRAHVYAVRVFK